ncbi:MAG: hypothetical protein HY790_06270 [Deltaproteobacteria bacterium]|nr:hypothetical protein [Deltaproteobacteria bacterium]
MIELEDPKTKELKRRWELEGEDNLTYDDFKYLLTHVALPYEQETIKNILIVRNHEQQVKETKKLVKVTWCLTIATWFVALATVFGPLLIIKLWGQ